MDFHLLKYPVWVWFDLVHCSAFSDDHAPVLHVRYMCVVRCATEMDKLVLARCEM